MDMAFNEVHVEKNEPSIPAFLTQPLEPNVMSTEVCQVSEIRGNESRFSACSGQVPQMMPQDRSLEAKQVTNFYVPKLQTYPVPDRQEPDL